MSKTDGGPAFPIKISNNGKNSVSGLDDDEIAPGTATTYRGMTLPDYFAAKALPALVEMQIASSHIASEAYRIADAMIAERAK